MTTDTAPALVTVLTIGDATIAKIAEIGEIDLDAAHRLRILACLEINRGQVIPVAVSVGADGEYIADAIEQRLVDAGLLEVTRRPYVSSGARHWTYAHRVARLTAAGRALGERAWTYERRNQSRALPADALAAWERDIRAPLADCVRA